MGLFSPAPALGFDSASSFKVNSGEMSSSRDTYLEVPDSLSSTKYSVYV